jgi:DNA-binding transcriptional MerR regulator
MKEEILKLRKQGLSYKKIQKMLGCSISTISYNCKQHHLNEPVQKSKRIIEELIEKLRKDRMIMTVEGLSKKYNIGISTIKKYTAGVIPRKKKEKKKRFCLECNNELLNYQRKFCSPKCASKYLHKQAYMKFYEGDGDYCTGYYTPKNFKDFFLEEQQDKCAICGNPPIWMNKNLVFVIDHIDGDASNNKRSNLRLICPNCDSQTDTFKSKTKHSKRRDYIRENIEKKYSKN